MDPKYVTGLELTDTELDEASSRLAFFAPTGAKTYVRELYEFLAMQALADLDNGYFYPTQIHERLLKLTGIQIEYEELIEALDRLAYKGEIDCTTDRAYNNPNASFSMSHDTRANLLQKINQQTQKEKHIIETWKEEIVELYPDISSSDLDLLESDLREYVYRLVSCNSAESVLLYYSRETELDETVDQLTAGSLNQVLTDRPEPLQSIRAEVLPGFFRTTDEDRKVFLDGLLQSTFILHMIQLDPTCSALVQAEIIGGSIYLDTNFIFRLLGHHSPEMCFAAQSLIELSQNCHYSFFVSPITKTEYQYALRNYVSELNKVPKLHPDLLKMVIDASKEAEDPVLAYYRMMKEVSDSNEKRQVYISSQNYFEYYSELEALIEPFGITTNERLCDYILKERKELDIEIGRLINYIDNKRFENDSYYYRELDPHVAKHDAFHRLLILQLRAGNEGRSFFDIPYWFLTCDTKLPRYDRIQRRREHLDIPFCVLSSTWLQTLRAFIPRLAPGTLVDSLNSPLLRAYHPIPNSVIRDVAGRLQMHRGYNRAIGKTAMKRQFLLQFGKAGDDEEQKEDLIESVFAQYAEDMEKTKEEAEQAKEAAEQAKETAEQALAETTKTLNQSEQAHLIAEKRVTELTTKIEELQRNVVEITRSYEDSETKRLEAANQQQELIKMTHDKLREEQNAREEAEESLATAKAEYDTLFTEQQKRFEEKFDTALHQQKQQLHKVIGVVSVLMIFVIALIITRPLISGNNWWFVLTGLLLLLYIVILIIWHPYRRGGFARLLAIGAPLLIVASAVLPFGQGVRFFDILDKIANVGGWISLVLLILSGKESS